jgi:hypothetical protein
MARKIALSACAVGALVIACVVLFRVYNHGVSPFAVARVDQRQISKDQWRHLRDHYAFTGESKDGAGKTAMRVLIIHAALVQGPEYASTRQAAKVRLRQERYSCCQGSSSSWKKHLAAMKIDEPLWRLVTEVELAEQGYRERMEQHLERHPPADGELRQWYVEHPELFEHPTTRKVTLFVLGPVSAARASQIRSQLLAGRKVVRGGRADLLVGDDPALQKQLEELATGEIGPPIRTEDGYLLLRPEEDLATGGSIPYSRERVLDQYGMQQSQQWLETFPTAIIGKHSVAYARGYERYAL